ncbi:MAG: GAF domain-containing protein [Actinobacteria bacterium]|nr:GAF domain-containing protein [Actinomycetota bacterium]
METGTALRLPLNYWEEVTRFGLRVCASLNVDRVEDVVLTSFPGVVGADAVGLYILDERHMPVQVTRVGASDALVHDIESLGRSTDPFLKRVLRTREPVDDQLMYGGSGWLRRSRHGRVLAAHGFAHSMIVPLFQESRLVGTINLARKKGSPSFRAAEARVGMELGRFAAIGISNALVHTGFRRRAEGTTVRAVPIAAGPDGHRVESLTARETEVLELVAAGLRNGEIAGELNVTVHTVKQHLKNAYQKLGVSSRVQAIRHLERG